MGIVELEGMEFIAYHGFYKEENVIGNRYTVDIKLKADFSLAIEQDKLDETLNYEVVYRVTREEMEIPSKLMEHVAGRIKKRLLASFPKIQYLRISIKKHNPPLGGLCKYAGVCIEEFAETE